MKEMLPWQNSPTFLANFLPALPLGISADIYQTALVDE
jgi:hypothetical protein